MNGCLAMNTKRQTTVKTYIEKNSCNFNAVKDSSRYFSLFITSYHCFWTLFLKMKITTYPCGQKEI